MTPSQARRLRRTRQEQARRASAGGPIPEGRPLVVGGRPLEDAWPLSRPVAAVPGAPIFTFDLASSATPPQHDPATPTPSVAATGLADTDAPAGKGTRIGPLDLPTWVTIDHGRALLIVRCDRCAVQGVLYHLTARSQPELLQGLVDDHAGCLPRAA